MSTGRHCPQCQTSLTVSIGTLVYPGDPEWRELFVLICWACGVARRRGRPWETFSQKRHEKLWKRWRQDFKRDDRMAA